MFQKKKILYFLSLWDNISEQDLSSPLSYNIIKHSINPFKNFFDNFGLNQIILKGF